MREYSKEEVLACIDNWIIGKNAERNKLILDLKIVRGWSYERVASWLASEVDNGNYPPEYKVEVRQLKRIVYKGQETLFRHL